jgi:GDP-D-mannose 3',5'-epimerase
MTKSAMKTALVLGAGGFVGSHMVKRLKSEGYWVRGVDLKYPEFSDTEADEFILHDLRSQSIIQQCIYLHYGEPFNCPEYFDEVYQFAADMGGAGYVFTGDHDADIMWSSAQININIARGYAGSKAKIFYSSSACMYPQELQDGKDGSGFSLPESLAYPANPDSEYGWEKLFSERLYLAFSRNYRLDVRIARFHNIYGPEGTYIGGKEKAPAAMCRKAIEAIDPDGISCRNFIDVWGKGDQTRSFLYIDDCIDAVRLLMQSDYKEPINIGSEEMITINLLAAKAIVLSGKKLLINNVPGPLGVQGRNSDNTVIRKVLGWEPKVSLDEGLTKTYNWIKSQHERNV